MDSRLRSAGEAAAAGPTSASRGRSRPTGCGRPESSARAWERSSAPRWLPDGPRPRSRTAGRRLSLYRHVRRGRLSLFDPRPVLDLLAADLGDPRIEDLSIPLGITTYDLVTGRPRLITTGRLVDALEKSIAVPLLFPPRQDAEGIWCDAGPWEGVPVSLARAWAPDDPVIGVVVVGTKPAFLTNGRSAAFLRATSSRLGTATPTQRLTARGYLGLLAARYADPVVVEAPDLLISPRLGKANALQFGHIAELAAIGERDARLALAGIGLAEASEDAA